MRNCYGDSLDAGNDGRGVDIASQRLDDLDQQCLKYLKGLADIGTEPLVADLGCGQGAMARAMAEVGASVVAVDLCDFRVQSHNRITFVSGDLSSIIGGYDRHFHSILCQRTIHYLSWGEAREALKLIQRALSPDGLLFLSASGLDSELSKNYPAAHLPPGERFVPLDPEMATKHKIFAPVCLYRKDELLELVTDAGFQEVTGWLSTFGNVKLMAKR